MPDAIVITPVKDAIANTLTTVKAIYNTGDPVHHVVYNDFSTSETRSTLEALAGQFNFELINLEEKTTHPSPNYLWVLQDGQARALKANIPLIIVESDVEVNKNTFQRMLKFKNNHPDTGLLGAVTVDQEGMVNFPYLKFKKEKKNFINTNRSLSFCCTLISLDFLKAFSFSQLDSSKDWYDTFISSKAVDLGFKNYVLMDTPVLHRPHGSRPWKKLKYTNPLKYYFLKFIKGRDKI